MLIFLNRTGYNGLFRVNARGEFNVPAGRYGNPTICDEPTCAPGARRSSQPARVASTSAPFDAALADAGAGDFVYLDPPYAPLSGTARFTSYTAGGFDALQQEAAAAGGHRAGRARRVGPAQQFRGAPDPAALCRPRGAPAWPGLRATTVAARRAINSRAASRGPVREYLITNVPRCKLALNVSLEDL